MLIIHLSSLAFMSFLPGANAGVAIKKVCLRQQGQTKVSTSRTDTVDYQRNLFIEADGAEKPANEAEIRHCNVKLFCPPAITTAAFTRLHSQYQEPGYIAIDYFSLTTTTEPDPPRFG